MQTRSEVFEKERGGVLLRTNRKNYIQQNNNLIRC
jgi:hypothetical protein